MYKLAVTGSEGFFASRFIEFYKDKYCIIPLSHKDLDIKDYDSTVEKIMNIKPDYLVHAAAISDTSFCEKNTEISYDVNVCGSVNIAKACCQAGAKMIYLSSDQVYNGNEEAGPYSETILPVANTVYGRHKLEAEESIRGILRDAVILRLTWLYCLPERNKKAKPNIIWNVIKAALNNKPLNLPDNEYRGITYVYDLVSAFEKILELPGGIYNTGSENNLSTYKTGEIVLKAMGLERRINELLIRNVDAYKYKSRDLRICNSKLKEYGIHFDDTEKAIRKCIDSFGFYAY